MDLHLKDSISGSFKLLTIEGINSSEKACTEWDMTKSLLDLIVHEGIISVSTANHWKNLSTKNLDHLKF